MHFKQLEAFVAVLRYGSFSKAAEALYLSQPTVSAHVSALENELGAKLIIRSTKTAYPSAAGKVFQQYAQEILRLCDKAVVELRHFSDEIGGDLPLAASTVPAQYLLPPFLRHLHDKYPKLFFDIRQYDSGEVVRQVLADQVEIGISGTVIDKSGCMFEPFCQDRLVIITPNQPPYTDYAEAGGQISAEAIKAAPFVLRERDSGTRKESQAFLASIGINPRELKTIAQLQSTESVKQAVKNGLGISIVSQRAVADECAMGLLLAFDYASPFLNREFYLVRHRGRPLSPIAEAFCHELRSFYKS